MIIETQTQINTWYSEILENKNRIDFLKDTLKNQYNSMLSNNEYTQEDIDYIKNIIDLI